MSLVNSNSQGLSQDIVKCICEAASKADCSNNDNTSRVLKDYPWSTTILLQGFAFYYQVAKDGERSESTWSRCFKKGETQRRHPKEAMDRYKERHEELLLDALTSEDKLSNDDSKQWPLPGSYTMYAIIIQQSRLFGLDSFYHVGTLCVYNPLKYEEEYKVKKCISLDISPLQEARMDGDVSIKQALLMCKYCVEQLHEFADQLGIGLEHRVTANLKCDYEQDTRNYQPWRLFAL